MKKLQDPGLSVLGITEFIGCLGGWIQINRVLAEALITLHDRVSFS